MFSVAIKNRLFTFVGLIALLLSQACMREKLISKQIHRDYKVDTLYTEVISQEDLRYSSPRQNFDPLVLGGFLYLPGMVEDQSQLLKVDLSTGEVVWSFSDFATGDNGFAAQIAYRNGLILYESYTHAYVVDAELGSVIFTYEPEDSVHFRGAALGDHTLFVTFFNHSSGSWLQQVNLNTGYANTVKHLPLSEDFYPLAQNLHYVEHQQEDYLLMEIMNRVGYNVPLSYFYAPVNRLHDFELLSLPVAQGVSSSSPRVMQDTVNKSFIVLDANGVICSYNLDQHYQLLQWINSFPHWGGDAGANDKYLYLYPANHLGGHLKVNKITGVTTEFPVPGKFEAANNDVVLTSSLWSLSLNDPESGQQLKVFDSLNLFNVHDIFSVSEDEFVFLQYHQDSTILGKIRITPLF